MDVKIFEKRLRQLVTFFKLSKEQVLAIVESVFMNIDKCKNRQENLLLVDRNLKIVQTQEHAAAVVALLQEDDITDEDSLLGFNLYHRLVNIAFFEPIGHNASLIDSIAMNHKWRKTYYPQYHSTLISLFFYKMALKCGLDSFKDSWLRSRENERYSDFRSYPIAACPYDVAWDEKLPNVYVSLVMTIDDFIKLNPKVDFSKYYTKL